MVCLEQKNLVLATGGGSYIQDPIRDMISKHAYTLWLRADVDILLERVSRRDTRPLLANGNKRKILTRLVKERYPIYEKADMVIDSSDGPHEDIVHTIIDKLKSHEHGFIHGI